MYNRQIIVFIGIGLFVLGCGTSLSTAGQNVRVGKAPPHANCRELGIVYGSGGGGAYTSTEGKVESAHNELRNKAAEKGGNFVVLDTSSADINGVTISGRAFSCGNPPRVKPIPVTIKNPQIETQHQEPPPQVKEAEGQPQESTPPTEKTPEERLKQLQDLRDKELITQEEYEKRREEILQSI